MARCEHGAALVVHYAAGTRLAVVRDRNGIRDGGCVLSLLVRSLSTEPS
jgi:hypothetical protein